MGESGMIIYWELETRTIFGRRATAAAMAFRIAITYVGY